VRCAVGGGIKAGDQAIICYPGGLAEGIAGWAEVAEFVLQGVWWLGLSGERGRYHYQDQQGFG
jgi:hypothetical protein